MNVKVTIKMGDETIKSTNDDIKSLTNSEQNLSQLLMFKAYMDMMIKIIEAGDPNMKNKRIEIITEFEDDGYYMVLGRKPKEEKYFGT